MPTTRILTPPTPEAEPVTLSLADAALRLDLDLESTDAAIVAQRDYLQLLISAAREKVEAYTGRYFAPQEVEITFRLDEAYTLPSGATATAVSGFYTDLQGLANASAYLEEYRKGISISRDLPWNEALAQTYKVTATTTGDTQFQALAKTVMLKLVAEWWKNRELSELPVSLRVELQPAVLNPLGY